MSRRPWKPKLRRVATQRSVATRRLKNGWWYPRTGLERPAYLRLPLRGSSSVACDARIRNVRCENLLRSLRRLLSAHRSLGRCHLTIFTLHVSLCTFHYDSVARLDLQGSDPSQTAQHQNARARVSRLNSRHGKLRRAVRRPSLARRASVLVPTLPSGGGMRATVRLDKPLA